MILVYDGEPNVKTSPLLSVKVVEPPVPAKQPVRLGSLYFKVAGKVGEGLFDLDGVLWAVGGLSGIWGPEWNQVQGDILDFWPLINGGKLVEPEI